jgi:hypothetical protein
MRSDSDLQCQLLALLSAASVATAVDVSGRHTRIRFALNGTDRFLIIPRSGSVHRGPANARAMLKHMLRDAPYPLSAAKAPKVERRHGSHHRLGMGRQEKCRLVRARIQEPHPGGTPAPAAGFAALALLKDRMAARASAQRMTIRIAVNLPRSGRYYITGTGANSGSLMISPNRGEALRLFSVHDAEILFRQAMAAAPPGARHVLIITASPAIAPAGAGSAPVPVHSASYGTDRTERSPR